ncbi:MAG: pyridoxal phosphate-dependent aminotransferase [Gammaproteobacteria bacterium]|nr:pyridoxal phosphate-dependent aminotransferase [Gammaproteobacteria bacterium]
MPIKIADRMSRIRPFYVMELLARARELEMGGRSIIHMEVGEPDFPAPDSLVAAGKGALDRGCTRYLPACGLPELRCAVADFYRARFGVSLDSRRVIITPGASGALQLIMSVLVEQGDEVLMTDPGYPCNRHFVELAGGTPVPLPVGPDSDYQLTAERVAAAWNRNTVAALVATPSNPTGTLLARDQLNDLYRSVASRGGTLLVDEIYQGLVYDEPPHTALAVADDLFVVNSFSKYFGMTGWRLGWLVAPEGYLDALERLAQNIFISSSSLAQFAALSVFSEENIGLMESRRIAFKQRRDYLLPALQALGFRIKAQPKGAFYLYADCSDLSQDSSEFCRALLEEVGVAATPGKDFGSNQPERYIRFAYTTGIPRLEEGVARIARFLAARKLR